MARKAGFRYAKVSRRRPSRAPKPTLCPVTGKRRFPSSDAAVIVLHQAQSARRRADSEAGFTRRQERRHYFCHHCRGWHTSSQSPWGDTAIA